MTPLPSWLAKFIAESVVNPPDHLTLESTFEDACFDNITPIELDCLIEELTGEFCPEEDIDRWDTLGDVVASYERVKARKVAA